MSDLKLFRITEGHAAELEGYAAALEKSLQELMEQNLEPMLGVRFLASEHSTGPQHGGRIDTLGLDENGTPVIVEYKRALNENVINQGLFYLDWLLDHRAEFKLLVMEQFGKDAAESIEWLSPRLVCIAGAFSRYDEHAVKQMNRDIELIRYRRFGDELVLLELVNATTTQPAVSESRPQGKTQSKTVSQVIEQTSGELRDLYEELKATLQALGDDVQTKTLKFYVAFKRLKNFACVEVHPAKGCVRAYVKVDPDSIDLVDGFTRDVRSVGHYGTGDLEITLRTQHDIARAHELLVRSYEAS